MDKQNKVDKKMENCARAYGSALPISTKQSIEICNYIRGKSVDKAISILNRVKEKKEAIPYKRFNNDVGHKPGIGPGRYPQKSTDYIIKLIESAKANAQAKGLNTDNLKIAIIIPNKASTPWRAGRHRRRKAKRTHLEIVLEEVESKKSVKKIEKPVKETKNEKVEEDKENKSSESKVKKEGEKIKDKTITEKDSPLKEKRKKDNLKDIEKEGEKND